MQLWVEKMPMPLAPDQLEGASGQIPPFLETTPTTPRRQALSPTLSAVGARAARARGKQVQLVAVVAGWPNKLAWLPAPKRQRSSRRRPLRQSNLQKRALAALHLIGTLLLPLTPPVKLAWQRQTSGLRSRA